MAHVYADRVKETSTTTGTGTFNLSGPTSGFRSFVSGIGTGNTTVYACVHQTLAEWEIGVGTVTDAATDTLSRTTILASSNANAAVSFSSGTKDVFCTMAADRTVLKDASGNAVLGTPASGVLTNCTGLPISTGVSGLGTGVATFLATPSSANLVSALTDETGSGKVVFDTSPTITSASLVTPALGTPTSGTLTNCTFPTLNQNTTGSANSLKSNATTGLLQVTGPAAASTRVMTTPDANFTAARTDAAQTFTGVQTFSSQPVFNGGTASTALALDASKNVTSVTNTGSGSNVLATSPTLTTPTIATIKSASATAPPTLANSSGTEYGTLCRAWVNFDGTGTNPITPRAAFNCTSVTKNATGNYTVNFASAMPDANYCVVAGAAKSDTINDGNFKAQVNGYNNGASNGNSTTATYIITGYTNVGTIVDSGVVTVAVFR